MAVGVFMSTYRYYLDISTEQWIALLTDKTVFKDNDITLLEVLYECPGHRQKASVLAPLLGVSSHGVLNLQIFRLGSRIINKLPDIQFPTDEQGSIRYWAIPFWAEDAETKGQYFWELRPELKKAIEKLSYADEVRIQYSPISISGKKGVKIAEELFDEEIDKLPEGAKKQITVNAYERNPRARKLCLQKYGFKCSVCGFDFEEVYGEIGIGYIHVHHLKPLNEINEEYEVDPINDLKPVCPNCHSMLHKAKLSIEQLRELLKNTI